MWSLQQWCNKGGLSHEPYLTDAMGRHREGKGLSDNPFMCSLSSHDAVSYPLSIDLRETEKH